MTWKGINPVVKFVRKAYQKGVSLTSGEGKDTGIVETVLVGNINTYHLDDLSRKTKRYIQWKIRSMVSWITTNLIRFNNNINRPYGQDMGSDRVSLKRHGLRNRWYN